MPRQLLVDVSVILRHDAQSGVQRVVRAILRELLLHPPAGCRVRPIFAGRWRGYRYADEYGASLLRGTAPTRPGLLAPRVVARAEDVFLAVDLAPRTLPRHASTLRRWKRDGVRICFVVHDLLPALHEEWFTPGLVRAFKEWLDALANLADPALCTTRTGEAALRRLLEERYGAAGQAVRTGWFHLGSDVEASAPSAGMPANLAATLERLRRGPNGAPAQSILMVGTLEPRKGYTQALDAFEKLWQGGEAANLLIVGRPGWGTDTLVRRLRTHAEAGRRLHWFDAASDELLRTLYGLCDGLLFASEAEGFGLPLVEVAHYGKPVLARDIPVFRELAGKHVRYFSGAADLPQALGDWLADVRAGRAPDSGGIARQTWRESAQQMLDALGVGR